MTRKVQDVLTRVRETLQDAAGVRYTDPQLISHLQDALLQCRSVRPDLFVGQFETPLPDTLALTDDLPVPDQFFAAVCMYVSGMAELRDDEFAVDGRAMVLSQMLAKKLTTGI